MDIQSTFWRTTKGLSRLVLLESLLFVLFGDIDDNIIILLKIVKVINFKQIYSFFEHGYLNNHSS